jgi:hypothetical protein
MGEKPFGAGTPAFMALSAHTTLPSPREDIESMIYLLAELLLRIQAAIRGEQLKPTDDTYLPWDLAAEEETKQASPHYLYIIQEMWLYG